MKTLFVKSATIMNVLLLCLAANVARAEPMMGILNQETINVTENVNDVTVIGNIGPLSTALSADTLDQDVLLQFVLDDLGLTVGDVLGLTTDLVFDMQTSVLETVVSVTQEPGTLVIGDLSDPTNIIVVTGQVNVITTNTTTITDFYTFTVTGDLGQPPPVAVSGPPALALLAVGLTGLVVTRRRKACS